uniref:Phosphatidylinositol N-acetylglucosaminyltransferase subunit C n=1 Tax=Grammatophora oceanica TaxID=210454 RepID=A0A7S1YHR6_9STRA
MLAISLTFLVILVFNDREKTSPPTWKKTTSRTKDAVLLASILRLVSALLKTLTGSYSSDTLYALAVAGLLIHLLFCDYSYANGFIVPSPTTKDNGRLAFLGGTMSLNAALFSTVMLSSRLENNSTVFIFLSSSVILFCFYPAARNRMSTSQPVIVTVLVTAGLMFATWILLQSVRERVLFVAVLSTILFVAPAWKAWYLQHRKIRIHGPWDIAHITIKD